MRIVGCSERSGTTNPPRVPAAGHEYDEPMRANGKWLIQVRNVAPRN